MEKLIAERVSAAAPAGIGGPKRVVFLESAAAIGGIQRTTLDVARRLNPGHWRPLVICPAEGDLTAACRRDGVPVRILPRVPMFSTSVWMGNNRRFPNPLAWAWNVPAMLAMARRVSRILTEESPDLVITKGLFAHFYGGLAARKVRVPCLWWAQDFISPRLGGVYVRIFGHAARWIPAGIVAIGPSIVRQLPESARVRAQVIYNAIDTDVYRRSPEQAGTREELGIGADEVVIGNVARLTPWKGQHHLIEAFAKVAADRPTARLLLVGAALFENNDYEVRLRRRVAELGLEERVIFTGHRNDIARMLSAMDVFAFCSVEKDICPLSLLEAMAFELPVVAFRIEGLGEAITDGEQGLLVPVAAPAPLAGAIARLVGDSQLRRRLAANARQRVEEKFSLDRHLRLVEDAYDRVASSAKSHPQPSGF